MTTTEEHIQQAARGRRDQAQDAAARTFATTALHSYDPADMRHRCVNAAIDAAVTVTNLEYVASAAHMHALPQVFLSRDEAVAYARAVLLVAGFVVKEERR
jgi:hypothetical protein